jgi:hypothetical protein
MLDRDALHFGVADRKQASERAAELGVLPDER